MAEKITIAEININTDSFLKSATATKTAISQLREEQSKLKKNGEENTEQFVKNEADLKNLSATYRQQSNVLTSLVASNGQLLKSQEAIAIALDKEIVSINDARASNSELLKVRNELDLSTKEGAKTADLINKKLDENNQFIKENVSQYEKQKINIGNYTESIKQAINETSIFGNSLSSLSSAFAPFKDVFTSLGNGAKDAINQIRGVGVATEGLTKAQQASAIATNAVSGALKLFRVALIATGIGAIVVVLGSLIAFLSTTQAGIDKVTAVTRPLQAVFQSLLGVLQNFGGILIDTFNNPQKAIKAFSDLIKEQVINRFTALKDIIVGIFTFDGDQFKKGIDATTEANEKLIGRVKEVGQATSKFFNDAIERGKEIDRLTKEIEKSEINLNKERAIATAREKELLLISKDTSRSGAEREKAAREIIKIKTEEAEKEANILKLRIELLKVNQQNNDTNRKGNKELADLEAELILKQQAGRDAEIEQIRVISAARKEAQAEATRLAKERIDNAIRESKAQIDLFTAQQGFRKKDLEDAFLFEQDLTAKRLALLKQEFDAGKKSKTEYEAEKITISQQFLQKQAELTVEFARRDLDTFVESSKTLVDRTKFISEQIIIEENARLTALSEQRKSFADLQFQEGLITETEYQKQLTQIQKDEQAVRDANELARKEQKKEADRLDLENQRAIEDLIFQDELAIQTQRLEQKRLLEIANAEKTGADINKINQKYALLQANLNKKAEIAKVDAFRNSLQDIGGLLNAFGVKNKNLAIAFATADAFLSATKAYASQLIPGDPTSLGRATLAGAKALGFGLANVAKIATTDTKFEKGGLMEVGGNRHSQGGTKFVGSDGTRFEAEKGELIGVLNRNASQQFMNFNNAFGKRGGVGVSYAENGGIIARGLNSGQNDLEQIAILTAQAIAQAPPPIVTVEDINRVNSNVRVIENGASF
jgi:hypothetical protein